VTDLDIPDPLNPRHALNGGRTNAVHLTYTLQPVEESRYIDICLLYPSVLKYDRFPVGHPQIVTDDFKEDLQTYEGLIKSRVLPPR